MEYTTFKIADEYIIYYWPGTKVRQSKFSRAIIKVLYWLDKRRTRGSTKIS